LPQYHGCLAYMKLTQKQREALARLERYSALMPWWLAWELNATGATMAALKRRGYVEMDSDELTQDGGPAFYRITQAGHEQAAMFAAPDTQVASLHGGKGVIK